MEKQFLENAEIAFDKNKVVKEYKEEIDKKQLEMEELYKEIGRLTTKLSWTEKN